jgi:16S rRNA (cytosine967-C5)-methyltransferase
VGETVEVAPERARGFVNGVLRALDRRHPRWPVVDDRTPDRRLGACTSHPDWLVAMLLHQFGRRDTVAMLQLDNVPPAVTLRANRLRTTREALLDELGAAGVDAVAGDVGADAVVLASGRDPGALDCVRDGRASPQDQASQAVVAALDPQPGERVLDVAAAPGGKATAAAERMGGGGLVVAGDLHAGRARFVRAAVQRLGLGNVATIVADGRALPSPAAAFDRVLLDAPCSGLGVLRRRPEARWRVRGADLEPLASLQRALLAEAAANVRPGGRLVYSVCTLSDDETVGVDGWAEGALPGFAAVSPPGAPWRPHGRGALLLPHDAGTDGMFVLVLQRGG